MAGSVNKVLLIGNLGADPDVREFPSGDKYCNFSVATNESWRDRETGEQKDRTEWHFVKIYNSGLAKIAEQYLRKGSKVFIEGQLETRKWQDQSGQDRYTTEVVLRGFKGNLTLLDRPPEGSWSGGGDYDRGESNYDRGRSGNFGNRGDQGGQREQREQQSVDMSDLDDNIPF